MPLKLIPPDKAPGGVNYYIKGTYLGVRVRQSARTDRPALARSEQKRIERDIERGRFLDPVSEADSATFADAVVIYLRDCPDSAIPFVDKLLDHFGETPLRDFDQRAIDTAMDELYPEAKASTVNRNGIVPLAAILHRAANPHGLMPYLRIKKRKEAKPQTSWLTIEQADALIQAAGAGDEKRARREARREGKGYIITARPRLAPLLVVLFSIGARISEAINLTWGDVDLASRTVTLHNTKNGETYVVPIGEAAFEAIANLPIVGARRRNPAAKVFGWRDKGSPRKALAAACKESGIKFNFHMARHTYATWMRLYDRADTRKLMELGRWKDAKSTIRYQHVGSTEVRDANTALPVPKLSQNLPRPGKAAPAAKAKVAKN